MLYSLARGVPNEGRARVLVSSGLASRVQVERAARRGDRETGVLLVPLGIVWNRDTLALEVALEIVP